MYILHSGLHTFVDILGHIIIPKRISILDNIYALVSVYINNGSVN